LSERGSVTEHMLSGTLLNCKSTHRTNVFLSEVSVVCATSSSVSNVQ